MSISNQLLTGSFRGVPFLVEGIVTTGGRKNISYEFPNSDRRFVEDLGLFEKEFSFDIVVEGVGNDYFNRRDDLIRAFDEEGAGLLTHPYLINGGLVEAFVQRYSLIENQTNQGVAKFSVEFQISESNVFPQAQEFDFNKVFSQVVDLFNEISNDISRAFSISNRTNFFVATGDIDLMLSKFGQETKFLISSGEATNDYRSDFINFQDNKSRYIANSILLGENITELFNQVDNLGDTPREKFILDTKFFNFDENFERITPKTFYQRERLINTDIVIGSVNILSLLNAYKNLVDIEFENIDDLINLSNITETQYRRVIDLNYFDAQIQDNVGDFSEVTIDKLNAVRTTVRLALKEIRDELADIREITTASKAFLPFVYGLYGNLDNYEKILTINNFKNANFVPAGTIKVLQIPS